MEHAANFDHWNQECSAVAGRFAPSYSTAQPALLTSGNPAWNLLDVNAARPKIEHVVTAEQAGQALEVLVVWLAGVSHQESRELIRRGAVWLDRRRVQQLDTVVRSGAELTVHFPPSGSYAVITITDADILWEDDVLVALNKQAGWHANYTPWDVRGTIPYALAAFLRKRDGREPRLHLAHQLDRDTSGILLVSKHPAINPALQQLFVHRAAEGGIHKTYLALTAGQIEAPTFEVITGHGRGRHGLFRVYPLEEVGQRLPHGSQRVRAMQTHFSVIARHATATLVQATPITGRTHQIRLHLAHIYHPIIGDLRYGGPAKVGDCPVDHHLLHAARLEFQHPQSGRGIRLVAPLPLPWTAVLSELGIAQPFQGRLPGAALGLPELG